MAVGAGIFMALEGDAFADFREAYYFTVMSLTTVGYGDFSPGHGRREDLLDLIRLGRARVDGCVHRQNTNDFEQVF